MTDHYMATCPACGWGEGGFWTMAEANEAQAAHVCPPVERDRLRADLATARARVQALEGALGEATAAVTRNHERVEKLEAMCRRLLENVEERRVDFTPDGYYTDNERDAFALVRDARALLDDKEAPVSEDERERMLAEAWRKAREEADRLRAQLAAMTRVESEQFRMTADAQADRDRYRDALREFVELFKPRALPKDAPDAEWGRVLAEIQDARLALVDRARALLNPTGGEP